MTREEQLALWRSGYEAGYEACSRNHGAAEHRSAIAGFHQRRRADEQAKLDALILEAVAALADALLAPLPAVVCIRCRRSLRRDARACPSCHTRVERAA